MHALLLVLALALAPQAGPIVTIEADVSDAGSGVAGVQFTLDGVDLNAEVTAPDADGWWRTTWDATGVPEGQYTICGRARDALGNVGITFEDGSPACVTTTLDTQGPRFRRLRITPPGQQ